MNKNKVQSQLEWLTTKWWFYALFILIQFLPPIATKGYGKAGAIKFLAFHIMNNLMRLPLVAHSFPIFKLIPVILIIAIIFLGNKVSRIFSIYASIAYLIFNVLQNFSLTSEYGMGILTQNVVSMLIVSAFWLWEAYAAKNDFSPVKTGPMKITMMVLAFIAFWMPLDPVTKGMNFDPTFIVNNAAGLAFCMMTPVFLAVLIYYFPKVNIALLRVNSFAGLIIGVFNVMVVFADPGAYWWFGVLHIPLFVTSAYGFWLGIKLRQ